MAKFEIKNEIEIKIFVKFRIKKKFEKNKIKYYYKQINCFEFRLRTRVKAKKQRFRAEETRCLRELEGVLGESKEVWK